MSTLHALLPQPVSAQPNAVPPAVSPSPGPLPRLRAALQTWKNVAIAEILARTARGEEIDGKEAQ